MTDKTKYVNDMTRKEILSVPPRNNWMEEIEFSSLVIVPTRRKHDSGYRVMDFVAVKEGVPLCSLSGCSDVIHINGIGGAGREYGFNKLISPIPWSIDCLQKSGLLHIFCGGYFLIAGSALSSFELFARKVRTK